MIPLELIPLDLIPIAGFCGGPLLGQSGGTFWLPPRASTAAPIVDAAFYFVLWVATFFFLLIVTLMAIFVVRYRRRPGVGPLPSPSHNTALEIVWTVIPVGLVTAMFYVGLKGYADIRVIPPNAYEIRVDAQKWKWTFRYSNGYEDDNLHVPADEPVKLLMASRDVIHSLFIPAFRLKQDVVPGRLIATWFRANRPGEYDLECTEYCGTGHSDMVAKVIVHEPGEFEDWLQEAQKKSRNLPPVELGERLFGRRGCSVCHAVDGATVKVGPNLKGIFGRTRRFADGKSLVADEEYLRESIVDPSAKIVEGFRDQMPTFKGQLSDRQIDALIAYIKSLGSGK
jgi:cytochrome c oxidase subunit 2